MMATRLEDNREVWRLEGVVVRSVLGAFYFGVTAYCGESACSAVRDLPVCLKRGCFVQNKKSVGTGWGPSEWKGSCYVSIAYCVTRKVQAYSNS
jgi:hypothetical protein